MGYKPGNIVRKNSSYWGGTLGESQDEVGELCVVQYSYGERYGNGECYGGYSIINMETGGSSAWWDENKLDFISDGSTDLIQQLKEKANNNEVHT